MKTGVAVRRQVIFVKKISYNKDIYEIIELPFVTKVQLKTNLMKNKWLSDEQKREDIMNNQFTSITINMILKTTKTDPKVNLESIENTFQNQESILMVELGFFSF